jgi:hypothetical protein
MITDSSTLLYSTTTIDYQHDQAHNNQSQGQLLFQEREDDANIPTNHVVTQVDEHNTPININQGPIT